MALVAAFAIATTSAIANDDPVLVEDNNLNQLIHSLLSYSSVAAVCSDKENLGKLRSRLVRLLESAEGKGQFTAQGRLLYENTTFFVEAGAKEYRRQPYITCGEYKVHVPRLIEASDQWLKSLDD